MGRDSSVGIATRYGVHTVYCTVEWVPGLFPEVKTAGACSWPPTPIWHRSKGKNKTIPLLPLWGFVACYRVNFTINWTLLCLLYFWMWPYLTSWWRHRIALKLWYTYSDTKSTKRYIRRQYITLTQTIVTILLIPCICMFNDVYKNSRMSKSWFVYVKFA
jgi:hypothetical protein